MKAQRFLSAALVVGLVLVTIAAIVSQIDRKHPDPFTAAAKGQAGHLAYHLAAGLPPDARDAEGRTLLHLALGEEGNYEVVGLLLAGGAALEEVSAEETPLGRAAAMDRLREVKLFLDEGADPNRADPKGRTPLLRVKGGGRSALIVMELLAKGAALEARDPSGRSAREHLLTLGDPAVERLLAERSAH